MAAGNADSREHLEGGTQGRDIPRHWCPGTMDHHSGSRYLEVDGCASHRCIFEAEGRPWLMYIISSLQPRPQACPRTCKGEVKGSGMQPKGATIRNVPQRVLLGPGRGRLNPNKARPWDPTGTAAASVDSNNQKKGPDTEPSRAHMWQLTPSRQTVLW